MERPGEQVRGCCRSKALYVIKSAQFKTCNWFSNKAQLEGVYVRNDRELEAFNW